tara:strand:- start:1597 stop:1713 length:117 start_codon:yes stop_codon:yes gene_type:complete
MIVVTILAVFFAVILFIFGILEATKTLIDLYYEIKREK